MTKDLSDLRINVQRRGPPSPHGWKVGTSQDGDRGDGRGGKIRHVHRPERVHPRDQGMAQTPLRDHHHQHPGVIGPPGLENRKQCRRRSHREKHRREQRVLHARHRSGKFRKEPGYPPRNHKPHGNREKQGAATAAIAPVKAFHTSAVPRENGQRRTTTWGTRRSGSWRGAAAWRSECSAPGRKAR